MKQTHDVNANFQRIKGGCTCDRPFLWFQLLSDTMTVITAIKKAMFPNGMIVLGVAATVHLYGLYLGTTKLQKVNLGYHSYAQHFRQKFDTVSFQKQRTASRLRDQLPQSSKSVAL